MDNSDKILNPSTNRYVKKTSKLGKLILAGKTPPKKSVKPCSDSQIRNPNSQRCIKKTGKIARSLGNSPMTSTNSSVRSVSSSLYPSYSSSSSSNPVALPVIPSAYVPPVVVAQPQTLPKLSASTMSQLQRLDKIQKIKERNLNAIKIQSAIRNKLARKRYPLIFQDAPDFPQPFTTSQTDAILDKRNKEQIKMSKDIEYSKSLFNKDISLPKSDIDILKVVKNINTNIRNINKPNKPKIKKTNKRNAMDMDIKPENFYKKANRKIKETMPALIGAGIATGIGLSGRI